jgi:hypothetical protein
MLNFSEKANTLLSLLYYNVSWVVEDKLNICLMVAKRLY